MGFQHDNVKTAPTVDSARSRSQHGYATYYLTNQRFLGVIWVRGLHGKCAICTPKMRLFRLDDRNALGPDPGLQWLCANTSSVMPLWLSLANTFSYS